MEQAVTRCTVYLFTEQWQQLRLGCVRRQTNVSAVLRRLVDDELATWAREDLAGQPDSDRQADHERSGQ